MEADAELPPAENWADCPLLFWMLAVREVSSCSTRRPLLMANGTSLCWRVPRSTSCSKGSQTCSTNEVSISSQSSICREDPLISFTNSVCTQISRFLPNILQNTHPSLNFEKQFIHYYITSLPVAVLPAWVNAMICWTVSWIIAAEPLPEPPKWVQHKTDWEWTIVFILSVCRLAMGELHECNCMG